MKYLFIIIFLIPLLVQSQWRTSSGTSKFDGKYRAATVIGKGGEFPYTKPTLVLNKFDDSSPSLYLTNIGYTGCSDDEIYFAFNDSDNIFLSTITSTNSDDDALFISEFNNISMVEIIDLLKSKNKVYIRYNNSCGQNDYEFTLSGSTKAINYVAGAYFDIQKSIQLEIQENEKAEILAKQEEIGLIKEKLDIYFSSDADIEEIIATKILFNKSLVMFSILETPTPVELMRNDSILVFNQIKNNKLMLSIRKLEGGGMNYYVTSPQFERLIEIVSAHNEFEYIFYNWMTLLEKRNGK